MPYFKNLTLALMGRDPFREELEQMTEHYEKTAEKVYELNDLYDKSVESLDKLGRQVADYEKLVENLRTRIEEKEDRIKELLQQSHDYCRRLMARNEEIIEVMRKLKETERTSNSLSDLCSAMDSGDEEKMLMAVEYLGWNPYLVKIAQCHLDVLRRSLGKGGAL